MIALRPLCATALICIASLSQAENSARLALVMGNSAYASIPALDNPGHDARLMEKALAALDFDVTTALDLTYDTMRSAIRSFGESLESNPGALAVVYYAGHAVQMDGTNYLLPVDAAIGDASDISIDAIHLDMILHQIDHARPDASFVILDACRDNPFGEQVDLVPGLARTGAPRDTLLAYSTAPGEVALDGTGQNSPYTAALAKAMSAPGLTAEDMFKETRRTVLETTAGVQTPWEGSSLTRSVRFDPAPPAPPAAVEVKTEIVVVQTVPLSFWEVAGWEDMTARQQTLWEQLGWSEAKWSGNDTPPPSESARWSDLSDDEKAAATELGFSKSTW